MSLREVAISTDVLRISSLAKRRPATELSFGTSMIHARFWTASDMRLRAMTLPTKVEFTIRAIAIGAAKCGPGQVAPRGMSRNYKNL